MASGLSVFLLSLFVHRTVSCILLWTNLLPRTSATLMVGIWLQSTSEEEHEFLRTFINQVTGANQTSWIGAFDSVQGHPDNKGGAENCLQMNYKGKNWNDGQCNKMSPFVCSKKL
ncbi:hypothetical protein PFLUV_G00150170 [Perca fluviatilis]|uniref:C-type lectin domain-containing protein n=1 Tax=Perca fluviatilis TaxID=8168 RepID=A0A6A5F2R2_PERFL|nr:hypothetical protein PFLUV_G00150170 [Perca fluviatilis]